MQFISGACLLLTAVVIALADTPTQILMDMRDTSAANCKLATCVQIGVNTAFLVGFDTEAQLRAGGPGVWNGAVRWYGMQQCAGIKAPTYGCPASAVPGRDFDDHIDEQIDAGRCYWTVGPACGEYQCVAGDMELLQDSRGDGFGCASGAKKFCCPQ